MKAETPSGKTAESRAKKSSKENVRIRHVIVGILAYVKNDKSESGCKYGDECLLRYTVVGGHSIKKSKKSGGKGSVEALKESIQ